MVSKSDLFCPNNFPLLSCLSPSIGNIQNKINPFPSHTPPKKKNQLFRITHTAESLICMHKHFCQSNNSFKYDAICSKTKQYYFFPMCPSQRISSALVWCQVSMATLNMTQPVFQSGKVMRIDNLLSHHSLSASVINKSVSPSVSVSANCMLIITAPLKIPLL